MGLTVLLLIGAIVPLLVFWFWLATVAQVAKAREVYFEQADQSRVAWMMVVIFLGPIGAIMFRLICKPLLKPGIF